MITHTQYTDGNQTWTLPDGRYHRLDGPAVIKFDNTRIWYTLGQCHRLDGPAVEYSDGGVEFPSREEYVAFVLAWA